MTKVVDVNDQNSLFTLKEEIKDIDKNLVHTISQLYELTDFKPAEAIRILKNLGISEDQTPAEMDAKVRNTPESFILRKRFFDASISEKDLEGTLVEVISEMSKFVSQNVLGSLTNLIKSMIKLCTYKRLLTKYKDLSFRFLTKGENEVVILLIINISYNIEENKLSLPLRILNFILNRVHICCFASVIKTSFAERKSPSKEN